MIQPLVTFGLAAVVGVLALCDLCGPEARSSIGTAGGLVSVAETAPVQTRQPALPSARPQADAQPPVDTTARAVTQPAATPSASARRTVTLAVQGMTCGGCVLGTRKVLTRLPGVAKADVSYEKGMAVVTYDPAKVTVEQMIAAIKTLGYTATLIAPAAG